MAITFVTPREMNYLRIVEQTTKKRMTPMKPPSRNEALEGQQRLAMEKIVETIKNNELQDYQEMAKEVMESHTPEQVVAAALRILTKEPDNTPVEITEERPLPQKRGRDNKRDFRRGDKKGGSSRGRSGRSYNSSSRGKQQQRGNRRTRKES
jgi:ATP-dependent RNA helicase DeaD